MRRLRPGLRRVADAVIPWGVGLFAALVVLDEDARLSSAWVLVGLVLAAAQGVALRWRRTRPERAMAVALVAGLGTLLLAPETVLPVAGMVAIYSMAATRPPRVSLIWLAGLVALSATNFFQATTGDTFFTIAVCIGVWALGEAARNRRWRSRARPAGRWPTSRRASPASCTT